MELWALWEAAYLVCDRVPPPTERDFPTERDSGSDVARAYRALKDATHTGTLKHIKVDAQDTHMRRRVLPSDAVQWWNARADKAGPAVGGQTPMPTPTAVHRHRIARDLLSPVIDRACLAVENPADAAAVMAELEKLARLAEKDRPAPLAGVTSGGVQWRDGGSMKTLTRKALGDRLRRRAEARGGARKRGGART